MVKPLITFLAISSRRVGARVSLLEEEEDTDKEIHLHLIILALYDAHG
jgi:hypothetical protein